jgi:NTE family protein
MERIRSYNDVKHEIEAAQLDTIAVNALGKGITSLVFEGGGVRGIAFGGALKFLEEHRILGGITNFAGSSAGAIVATGVAIGMSPQAVIDEMNSVDFESFKDDSWGVVFDIIRLLTQFGIYKGDAFFKWFSGLLERYTGNANITFKQIHERFNRTLVITGTCLNRAKTYYFHHQDPKYADMPVALAVRISMSIPLFWKAVKLGDDLMVDGGVLNNYPIYVFDGDQIGDASNISDEAIENSKTLGLKLMTSSEKADNTLYHINEHISGPVEYAKAFLNATLIQIERAHIRKGYWERTVCINTHDVSSLDFQLSSEAKAKMIEEGYIAAKNHFYCRLQGVPNEMNTLIH